MPGAAFPTESPLRLVAIPTLGFDLNVMEGANGVVAEPPRETVVNRLAGEAVVSVTPRTPGPIPTHQVSVRKEAAEPSRRELPELRRAGEGLDPCREGRVGADTIEVISVPRVPPRVLALVGDDHPRHQDSGADVMGLGQPLQVAGETFDPARPDPDRL
jgi:hypothetical protein